MQGKTVPQSLREISEFPAEFARLLQVIDLLRGMDRRLPGFPRLHRDHRIAMAFAVAALRAEGPSTIKGADAAVISYPAFFESLDRLVDR